MAHFRRVAKTVAFTSLGFGTVSYCQAVEKTITTPKDCRFKPKVPDKDLFDLGGYTGVLDRVADLVRYLQDPDEYIKSGVKPPKGVILSGPPGVGKTFIAEAVAGHAGVPIFMISAAELTSGFIGASEQMLRQIFKSADNIAPCVICIDEFEAIAPRRITPDDSTSAQHCVNAVYINSIVDQLLTLLSQDHPGVVVIATTNHIEAIDPAVIRPGRFDKHIALALPNREERKTILEVHLKNKELASSLSLSDLAAISSGFSGAKIAGWVNEAALIAKREQADRLEQHHLDGARTLIERGIPGQNTQEPEQKALTAAHEAGHALVGHLLGQKVYKVSIFQYGQTPGNTEWIPPDHQQPTKEEVLNQICCLLAGKAAETLLNKPRMGNDSNFMQAKQLAIRFVEEGLGSHLIGNALDVEAILQKEMARAGDLLQKNRKTWERLQDSLINNGELLQHEFLQVIEGKSVVKSAPPLAAPLPLPPKAVRRYEIVEACQTCKTVPKEDSLPFTVEEVVAALKLDPSSVRSISKREHFGGYAIKFKPSYENEKFLREVATKLKKHDIESTFASYNNEIIIYPDGVQEFLEFLKKNPK